MRLMTLSAALVVLTGCASLEANIRGYGTVPTAADGSRGSYFIYTNESDQKSLERAAYTDRVRRGLNRNGFVETNAVKADYIVMYSYGVRTSGQTGSYTAPVQMAGGSAFAAGFNAASNASGGRVTTSDVCTRTFFMRLYDRAVFDTGVDGPPRYERQVRSTGSSCDLGEVLPTVIDAAFENFPGEPGKTYTVQRQLEK